MSKRSLGEGDDEGHISQTFDDHVQVTSKASNHSRAAVLGREDHKDIRTSDREFYEANPHLASKKFVRKMNTMALIDDQEDDADDNQMENPLMPRAEPNVSAEAQNAKLRGKPVKEGRHRKEGERQESDALDRENVEVELDEAQKQRDGGFVAQERQREADR